MATQIPPSYEEAIAQAKRLLAKPLSSEERIEYAQGAIEVLQDGEQIAKFEQDIENVAKAAIQIDVAFDRVTRGFQDMVDRHGGEFPGLSRYKNEWDGYNEVYKLFVTCSKVYLLTWILALGQVPLGLSICSLRDGCSPQT